MSLRDEIIEILLQSRHPSGLALPPSRFADKILELPEIARGQCKWTYTDDDYNLWETDCRQDFCLDEGTPAENHMKYCPFCGREIVEEKDHDPRH